MAQYMTQEELADMLRQTHERALENLDPDTNVFDHNEAWLEVASYVQDLTENGEPIEFVPYAPGLYVTQQGHHPARVHDNYSLSVLFPGRTDTFSPLTPRLWPSLTPATLSIPSFGELGEEEEEEEAESDDPFDLGEVPTSDR